MEKMILHLIQDKSTIRKLHILEALIDSNEIMSSKVLAQKLQCTSRTIMNDISQLKLILPENWNLISIKSKGYLLKRGVGVDVSHIITSNLINSELYKIILGIFNHKYYSLEKWSQLLYLDKLTLKKILKNFKNILYHFVLDFNFRTIQLVGQELNIRYFYIVFFYSIQKYKKIFNLPSNLQRKIEHITKVYDIEIDYNLLTIIIYVFINRITHKHFISENLDFEYIFSNNKMKCISAVISELECYFNINLSKKEVNFFKLSFFLISKGKKDEKVNITNYYKTKEKTYDKFLSVFNMISHKLNMGFKTKEKVKNEIFFTLHIINIFNSYNISIGEFWSEFETVPQEFLEGYNIIYPLISSWNKEINQNRLTKNEIYYMTYNILFILNSNYAKKGLLLLSGPTSLKNFIYYKLNKELGDILTLQQKTDYTNKYDFILTNYQITNSQIPIIQISSKTIQQDMCYIKKIISPYNKE
ncbi:helix-turn-helix domain containing protein [Bacillus thuringiensis]|uniref:HTH domain-containing protein n=1 Tax=Bacillus thuringiensis TaxID=1428 RepID=A0A9W3YKE1_BACTU|nr:helix-turn-helix domain containing protein [Bacillus thuringiensis]AMR06149.1 hypothetical protein AXW78_30445 [Bacillus thuringiensis]AYF84873.1 HTH domain-containing protein [Bacillus thuringiensis]PNK32303.1 hypothetical protein CBR55_30205 [Bacillus thuringiensis]